MSKREEEAHELIDSGIDLIPSPARGIVKLVHAIVRRIRARRKARRQRRMERRKAATIAAGKAAREASDATTEMMKK